MTNVEFAEVIAYIASGTGKALAVESQVVYWDLLGDLPVDIFWTAARRVLVEHKWASFPSVAELRHAAVESAQGITSELSTAKAWELAWKAVGGIDLDVDGSKERAFSKLPKLVAEAISAMGLAAMIGNKKEPVSVLRAQFRDIYEQILAATRRKALFPPAVHAALEGTRQSLTGPKAKAIADKTGGRIDLSKMFALPEAIK